MARSTGERPRGTGVRQFVDCPCGQWEWRDSDGTAGLHALNKSCPRCRNEYLLVFRGPELLGRPELHGHDVGSYRQALESVEALQPSEVEQIMSAVRRRAETLQRVG